MSSIVISGDTSGTVSLTVPAVAGTNTATLPAATGIVQVSGNMPAFLAYPSANQTFSNSTATLINFNTKVFDTNSNFDTNTYRFTPTVAGYYQVNFLISITNSLTTGSLAFCSIYKNGSEYLRGTQFGFNSYNTVGNSTSSIIYLNGSTDYINIYAYISATSGTTSTNAGGSPILSSFSASLVRAA